MMKLTRNSFKRLLLFLPPLIWMALIFYGSSRQRVTVSENFWFSFLFFKTLHVLEYGILFLLWRLALYGRVNGLRWALLISIIYGMTDEWHQSLVPTREARLRDVFIDCSGIVLFWRLVWPEFEKRFFKIRPIKAWFTS
ncbi:MAG: VanZ family protein [Patescibacteria group bacterium]